MELSLETVMLRRDVSLALYGKVKETAEANAAQMLSVLATAQPAAPAPHPTLGKVLDVRV